MAAKTELFERYLSCHVCSETFSDPVSLSCNHSFCLSCLNEFWEKAGNKNCPVCKRKSSKETLLVNFSLKSLADSFAGRQEAGSSDTDKGEGKVEVVCRLHQEETKLFCKDEGRVVCPVCEFSSHSQSHKVVPVEEAVGELKEQLRSDLKSLQDKRDKYKDVEETYQEVIQHSKKQLLFTERQIRAEFNKLQQLLKEEESSRLAAVREEEEQKRKRISREMERIQEQISSLSLSISAVEEELQKHSGPVLCSYKHTQGTATNQCSQPDPQLDSGLLTDVSKHLGNLSFRVWEKMRGRIHFSPVILDPNTAASSLHLSDDLTRVSRGSYQKLPDNPERFTQYANVLGSEGFNSGRHIWEVEVGDHPYWILGVAKESVDRKGERFTSPEHGFWCLLLKDGKYTNGLSKTVTEKKSLQRIRVELDYDGGEVSFYNTEDNDHIYTYRETFTERLFPYFSIGRAGGAKTSEIRICDSEKISL